MPNVLELFNQKTVLDYVNNREYKPFLGETLFPEVKHETLEFEYLVGASNMPVIASVHAFDTEAEIGSREAAKQALEAAYVKRKMQIKEKDLIALQFPRTPKEQQYLMKNVFNDVDNLVMGVKARFELMRMEALANGRVVLDENGLNMTIDYQVPDENKEALSGTDLWTSPDADIMGDLERWAGDLDNPTRALTSQKLLNQILRNSKMIGYLFGRDSARIPTLGDLNSFLIQHKLPQIATYDQKYRVQNSNGTYTTKRFFPENKFVIFGDGTLGETLYGPTPEESRMLRNGNEEVQLIDKIVAMVYEEGLDPVSTWTKAAATAIPSFPEANNVFQAQPIA